jgi:ribonucleoside-triphosphate reductase
MFVLKKDNKTKECFQEHKIWHAIEKAYKSLNREFDESVFRETLKVLGVDDSDTSESVISVYEIQDVIENIIFKRGDKELYDAFHWVKKKWLEVEYEKKLMCKSIENQNANVDEYSFGGREAESANVYRKAYALDRCVSKRTKRLHENNENYIHDLDAYVSGKHNCLTEPLNKVLNEGAIVGQTHIRPAASINSAMQITAVYFQIQSQEQFGGVSGSSYDWTLVPFVRKSFFKHYVIDYIKMNEELTFDKIWNMSMDEIDAWVSENRELYLKKFNLKFEDFKFDNHNKLDKRLAGSALLDTRLEAMQAAEALIHNLNTLQSRPGSQLPFSSLNYGTCYIPEGQLIIDCLLDASIRGTGKHHLTPIFPCGIFQMKKGVNRKPGDPNYHLFRKALVSTSKRIYPNYANCDWSNQKAWKKADIDVKEKVIGELNEVETQMFIERLKNNKALAEKLSILSFDNGNIVIDVEEKPYEYFGTMGK